LSDSFIWRIKFEAQTLTWSILHDWQRQSPHIASPSLKASWYVIYALMKTEKVYIKSIIWNQCTSSAEMQQCNFHSGSNTVDSFEKMVIYMSATFIPIRNKLWKRSWLRFRRNPKSFMLGFHAYLPRYSATKMVRKNTSWHVVCYAYGTFTFSCMSWDDCARVCTYFHPKVYRCGLKRLFNCNLSSETSFENCFSSSSAFWSHWDNYLIHHTAYK
jgi:hypothetical protein